MVELSLTSAARADDLFSISIKGVCVPVLMALLLAASSNFAMNSTLVADRIEFLNELFDALLRQKSAFHCLSGVSELIHNVSQVFECHRCLNIVMLGNKCDVRCL